MTLQDIFDQLMYGELSQISVGGAEAGEISKANYPRIMAHITLGLTTLYKRFQLKEGTVVIKVLPGVNKYTLDSNGDTVFVTGPNDEDFDNDVLKIEEVITDLGVSLPVNDRNNPYSVQTPNHTTLVTPSKWKDGVVPETLTVVYRANHPAIRNRTNFRPSNVSVELPESYLEALLLFVVSRINNPIGMTNEFHAGNSYAAKFEQECARLEMVNLQIDQGQTNSRLHAGGWV